MAVHPAQSVYHCVQQAADHGVPPRLSSQADQWALRIGPKENAFVVRRLVNAGGRVPRVLHGWKTIQEPTKNCEWGPLGVQTARGHLLCGAVSEWVVCEVHDGGQQELDACLLGIGVELQCRGDRFLALFVQLRQRPMHVS